MLAKARSNQVQISQVIKEMEGVMIVQQDLEEARGSDPGQGQIEAVADRTVQSQMRRRKEGEERVIEATREAITTIIVRISINIVIITIIHIGTSITRGMIALQEEETQSLKIEMAEEEAPLAIMEIAREELKANEKTSR